MASIGERIRFLRTILKLSQEEFAKQIGISKRALIYYEQGKKQPSEKVLKLISQTFGVSYRWLKEGKGEIWEKKEEPPEWLKEFMKEASDEDIEIVKALIDMLKEVPEEEKPLLKMMLKKLAGSSRKK